MRKLKIILLYGEFGNSITVWGFGKLLDYGDLEIIFLYGEFGNTITVCGIRKYY
jgi:hypothetical protein